MKLTKKSMLAFIAVVCISATVSYSQPYENYGPAVEASQDDYSFTGGKVIEPYRHTIWSAETAEKDMLIAQSRFLYRWTPGTYDSNGNYTSYDENTSRTTLTFGLQAYYGITDRFEASLLPTYTRSVSETATSKTTSQTIDDLNVFFRYGILPRTESSKLALSARYRLPTGDEDEGDGQFMHEYGLQGSFSIMSGWLHTNLSYLIRTEKDNVKSGNVLVQAMGFEYPYQDSGWSFMLAMYNNIVSEREVSKIQTDNTDSFRIDINPSVAYAIAGKDVVIRLGYNTSITGRNSGRYNTIYFGTTWQFGNIFKR